MTLHIRCAGPLDASPIADLLNAIIAKGGTTAMVKPLSASDIRQKMAKPRSVWTLAEDDTGTLKGVQWIEPHPDLPPDAADVASYVRLGETGLGVGSALFRATQQAARDLGYTRIDAIIRADNTGGLAYYQSRGFEVYRRLENMVLDDGAVVDKLWKIYRLD